MASRDFAVWDRRREISPVGTGVERFRRLGSASRDFAGWNRRRDFSLGSGFGLGFGLSLGFGFGFRHIP